MVLHIAKYIDSNLVFWEATSQYIKAEYHCVIQVSSPALQDCHPGAKQVMFLFWIWLLSASKDTARVLGVYWEVLGVKLPCLRDDNRRDGGRQLLDRKCPGLSKVLPSFAANLCMRHVLCLLVKLTGLGQEPSFNFSPYNTKTTLEGNCLHLLPCCKKKVAGLFKLACRAVEQHGKCSSQ